MVYFIVFIIMHISNDSMKVRDRNAPTNIQIYKEKSKKSNNIITLFQLKVAGSNKIHVVI